MTRVSRFGIRLCLILFVAMLCFPLASAQAQPAVEAGLVIPTNLWCDVYSLASKCDNSPLPKGSIVQAFDPQGVLCGQAVAHNPGQWGLMHVYGDDPTTDADEGAKSGDVLRFAINGQTAQTDRQVVWQARERLQVNLSAPCGYRLKLPLVLR